MAEDLRITIDALRNRMDAGQQFVFVDTRNPQAWGESDVTLPGAVRMPAEQVEAHLSEIPKNKPVVTYCT